VHGGTFRVLKLIPLPSHDSNRPNGQSSSSESIYWKTARATANINQHNANHFNRLELASVSCHNRQSTALIATSKHDRGSSQVLIPPTSPSL